MRPSLPNASSEAYLWWSQGARDNEEARKDGLSTGAAEMVQTLEALAKLGGIEAGPQSLVISLAKIYCPHILRWRYRRDR